jgi:hypothetical protein
MTLFLGKRNEIVLLGIYLIYIIYILQVMNYKQFL